MESIILQTPKSVRCTEMSGTRARTATSKILKFGFFSMKESFFVHESGLLKYKWAKTESFFQTPNSVRPTEMP